VTLVRDLPSWPAARRFALETAIPASVLDQLSELTVDELSTIQVWLRAWTQALGANDDESMRTLENSVSVIAGAIRLLIAVGGK
jgi:hypothetical protein